MTYIDYSKEPCSDIAFVDMKSFYASVECVELGKNPLTTSLCVMSRADNSSGLILASSPTFKKVFGKGNVSRSYDLPFDLNTRCFHYRNAIKAGIPVTKESIHFIESWAKKTIIVPPQMGLYIQKNMEIQSIFQNYTSKEEILPYSIDEGFLDLSSSLNYFVKDSSLSKKDKLDLVSSRIQHDIWQKTGIYSTVGMSNSNPLLAKLALDNEAKKTKSMRANWSYEDVETKVWSIPSLTDFWGIGPRMALRLNRLGIHSIRDLALFNPDLLKKELGVIGLQLWFHANGVDESHILEPYIPQTKQVGNSQILPRDYERASEIELVLKEMAEQVAIRLRRLHKKCCLVSLYVGYSRQENERPISCQIKVSPTQSTKALIEAVLYLFRQKYLGLPVRQIGVSYGHFVSEEREMYSLFEEIEDQVNQESLEKSIDHIREKYGFLSVQKASSLLNGSRVRERAKLIGGHSAGGLDGLQ